MSAYLVMKKVLEEHNRPMTVRELADKCRVSPQLVRRHLQLHPQYFSVQGKTLSPFQNKLVELWGLRQ